MKCPKCKTEMFIMFHLAECCPKCEPVKKHVPQTIVLRSKSGSELLFETGKNVANRKLITPGWVDWYFKLASFDDPMCAWYGPYSPTDNEQCTDPNNNTPSPMFVFSKFVY